MGTTTLTDSLSFDLSTGESIYLLALLESQAQREQSFADAFDTLSMEFEDGGGLLAQSTIPEPGTAGLVALGVLGLACRKRRSRS